MDKNVMICARLQPGPDTDSCNPMRSSFATSCRKRRRPPSQLEQHQLSTWIKQANDRSRAATATKAKAKTKSLKFINLIFAMLTLITASNLLLVAGATESDNSNPIRGPADASRQQSTAATTTSNSSSSLPAATTIQTTTTTPVNSSILSTTPSPAAVLKRDVSAKLQQQQLLTTTNNAGQSRRSNSVCQVYDGESVAIMEIEESRGLDTSQTTKPGELPISGSVALGEIELKIESETHKYFQIQDKSLRLTRPLDRDATLKELAKPAKKTIIPVLVKVLDLNDNAPRFSQPVYSVQVNELAPIGTVIVDQLAYAIDLDSANNGQIEYSLLGASGQLTSPTATSSGLLPGVKSVVPPKLGASTPSASQRLVQRAEPNLNSAQTVATTSSTTSSSTSSSPATTTSSQPRMISGELTQAGKVSITSVRDMESSKRPSTNDDEPMTSATPVVSFESTTSDGEDDDESLVATTIAPHLMSANQDQASFKGPLGEPTINLNSEPILNGPMDESEEDESDEALLASLNAAGQNNSTDADGNESPPPVGDQSDFASVSRAGLLPRWGQLGARTKSTPGQKRRIKRTRRELPSTSSRSEPTTFTYSTSQTQPTETQTSISKRNKQLQMTTTTMNGALISSTRVPQFGEATSASGQPSWTNLMVIPSEEFRSIETSSSSQTLTNTGGLSQAQGMPTGSNNQDSIGASDSDLFASNDYFALEMSTQTNRPIIRLKRQLDYETKRVHQLTLVATDRAPNKHERLSSRVKIVIRVLDGDDQPPAFILDQVGCATGLVPQATSPLPPMLMASDATPVTPLPDTGASQNISATFPAVIDLLQQEAIDHQHRQLLAAGSSSPSSTSLVGQRRLPLQRPIRPVATVNAGGDLLASSTNQRLSSFKVTDENFDFGDTLGLDDVPLDHEVVAATVLEDDNAEQTTLLKQQAAGDSSQQVLAPVRARRITGPARARQPPANGAGKSQTPRAQAGQMMLDYLCLASNGNQAGSLKPTSGTEQLAEYFATVISGDSDYLLRVAPQSIKARDRDELNAPIRYSFINGTPTNYSHYFQINTLDGTIKQVAPIERTQINEFVLFIQAQEQSYNRLFSVAKLTIDVLPTDKSPPVLVPNSYSGFVDENSAVGSRVLVASSADGQQANLSLTSNEQVDKRGAFMRIAVVDADKAAAFQGSQKLAGPEVGAPQNKHANKQAKYEFETTSDAFKVDRDGYVYVNRFPLDRDPPSQSVHMFQVTARQVGLVSARSTSSPISLNITLKDLNDNPPQLLNATLGPIQLAANSRGGAKELIKIEALDRDLAENSRMRFSIQHVSNVGASRFRIDEDSGRIEALGKFQAGEQFSLTVQVVDDLGRSSQGIIDVQVVPGANTGGPQFLTETGNNQHQLSDDNSSRSSGFAQVSLARAGYYSVEVNEGVAVNSAILQVRAVDPENDPISYSIIDGNINNDFSINSKTGMLAVANKLDREEISAYKLIVQARDSGGLATSKPIHVLVTDSNDQNPTFAQGHYVFAVDEGVATSQEGHLLGRVSAHDSDEGENGRVSYSLVLLDSGLTTTGAAPYALDSTRLQHQDNRLFSVDATTGDIKLMQPLDYEQAKSHTLLVVARDNGENPRSSSAMVQVRVLDRQDELPYFERFHLETRLDENQPNQRVGLVQARDPDSVAQVTYVLLAGDSNLFQVDAQTGLVTTSSAGLDYEQARFHSLLIGTNESLAAKIDLEDETQRLSDAIVAKQTGALSNQQQSQPLERSAVVRIDVFVNDLNDNAPQFESGDLMMPVRVQDSASLGSVLPVEVRAHDLDGSAPNNQIRYELVTSSKTGASQYTSDRCAQLFLVDPSSGQISVRADLKRDSQSECQLIIKARDLPQDSNQSLSSQVSLTVYIDHLVEISASSMVGFADSAYTIELEENVPANTLAKLLTIINKPKATFPVSCEIISGNEPARFYVTENEQRDCELRTRDQLLDYEQKQRYTLAIKLNTVGGSSSRSTLTQVQINVLDKNDNRPAFTSQPARYSHLTQNKYLAAIAYDSPSETQLIQLRASDLDSSQANGLISYELLNEQELEGRFKVDAVDGILRTNRPIEDIPSTRLPIRMRVSARDNPEQAGESLSSVAEVVVNLIDDHHRIALVLKDTPAGRVLDNKEDLLSVIQERTGLISGLERVESLKVQRNLTQIEADVSGTDVWFYLIEPGSLRIVPSDDPRLKTSLFEKRAQNSLADIINQNLGFGKARVRLPYALTNELDANILSGSSNLLFGAIRASSNDRLAPVLIVVSLVIAVISAIVVIYQCGSVAGHSESAYNNNQLQQPYGAAQLHPSQLHQHFAKDKFLFSQLPPPSQFQFAGSTLAGADPLTTSQTPLGSLSRAYSANDHFDQYALTRSSFGPGGPAPLPPPPAPPLNKSASDTGHKEYETQMLKMSMLFDDGQSFDEQNLNDYNNVNKNLV